MKNGICLLACFCLLRSSIMAQNEKPVSVRITIENGVIEGLRDIHSGLQTYFGISFAKPPVGELRWKAPQSADSWAGVLETKKFGSRPIQINVWGDMIYRSENASEDCLYLNVWTPDKRDSGKLPVLVYFYGGGFVAGEASEPRYDGASMARKGMVVVIANYRLNIFGFFAHPELSAEAPYKASGNYGLLDQNAALKWVQRNIAAFGGNPDRVTIAGESAGSISVSSHMASPLSRNLIACAIGESGAAIDPTLAPVPLAEAEKIGLEFAEKAGRRTLAELRALGTDEIFQFYIQTKRFGFPSVVDGYFYPKTLPEIFKAGEQAQIPLLVGWNSAEITGMAFTQGPYTEDNYVNKVKEAYPTDFEAVLKLYPHGSEKEIELSATALASDRFIVYSAWKWFDLHRKNSRQPVYRYLFAKKRSGQTPEPIGAPHACEIEYCMGNLDLIKTFAWTDEDYKVSKTMQDYFANFILTGNPNGKGLPDWLAAKADDPATPVMVIDVESKAVKAPNDDRYLFLDKAYGKE